MPEDKTLILSYGKEPERLDWHPYKECEMPRTCSDSKRCVGHCLSQPKPSDFGKNAAVGIWPPLPYEPPEWPEYLMGFARHAATKSKDTTKVGAILVGPEGEVRLTGYNGIPRGVQDLPERRERPAKYEWASHAETNLIAFAAREGIRTKGCTVYTTHQPCAACTRTLIQAGVAKVVYGAGSFAPGSAIPAEMQTAATMFREAGIECVEISE